LVGQKNFKAFQCPDTPIENSTCHVYAAKWTQQTNKHWCFDIVANRFVYHMIRNLVADQLAVASNRIPMAQFLQWVNGAEKRQGARYTAKACGLTLMTVYYPPSFKYFKEYTVDLQLKHWLSTFGVIE
jgi:tRNA pseudouridine38-40 synthase